MTNIQNILQALPKCSAALAALVFLPACATPREQTLRQSYTEIGEAFSAQAESIDPATLASLDDYLAAAYRRNPRLRAAYHRWEAALEAVPQARTLEDPSLAGTLFTEQVDTRYSVTLSQMLPTWGTLRARTAQAGALAQAAMHAFEAERLDTFERVVRAVMEYRYIEQSIAITAEQVDLLNNLQKVIAARYRSGNTEFPDWTQIRIEQERMQDRLAGLHDRRQFLSENLASLLHIQPLSPLPWIAAGTREMPPPETLRFDDLLARLEELNPDLLVLDAKLEAAEHQISLAKRKGWPQPMVGIEWMQMANMPAGMEDTDVGLMAGITLPIWRNKYRAMKRQAEAQRDAITQERKALYAAVRAELAMATSQYQDTSRRLERYHTSLIPQSEKAAQVAQQAYANGRMEFAGMIDAYRTMLDVRLMAARAEADRGIAFADIGCCLGDPDFILPPPGNARLQPGPKPNSIPGNARLQPGPVTSATTPPPSVRLEPGAPGKPEPAEVKRAPAHERIFS